MGPVDESGKDAAHAAEPVKSENASAEASHAAGAQAAPEIKVERIEDARRRKLADTEAPAIFVPTARQRFSRAAVMAVAIALSGAIGSAVGAVAAVAYAKSQPAAAADQRSIEVNALRGVIAKLSSEVASLKSAIETNAKTANTQMARIAERVERAEKAQAEPVARVAKLSELLERIDKRTAAAAAPAPALAAAPETTGSVAKQQDRAIVVDGWSLREVFRGGALVENDRMGVFEVVPGANLPGLGRVETIRRQDGRWVVVTPKGFIVSQR
jgi:hypothetical protein